MADVDDYGEWKTGKRNTGISPVQSVLPETGPAIAVGRWSAFALPGIAMTLR